MAECMRIVIEFGKLRDMYVGSIPVSNSSRS